MNKKNLEEEFNSLHQDILEAELMISQLRKHLGELKIKLWSNKTKQSIEEEW